LSVGWYSINISLEITSSLIPKILQNFVRRIHKERRLRFVQIKGLALVRAKKGATTEKVRG